MCGLGSCIKYLYVLAHQSDIKDAETKGNHTIQLQANDQVKTAILPSLNHIGEMWELSLEQDFGFTNCVKIDHIDSITVLANSTDGWNIASIVTFLVINPYYWELSSVDFGINQWIDGNGEPSKRQYMLTLFV